MRNIHLTKSRFKIALECVTKLYYTAKKDEYPDKNIEDTFLKALADGGNQVGELAKFYFCDDPIGENITIDTLNYDEALARTDAMLTKPGRVVIAEAAFKFGNLFVRADIAVKEGNSLFIYEVKAKSWKPEKTKFLTAKEDKVASDWIPYIYDAAFQKYVVSNSETGKKYKVKTFLMLVDKSKTATIEGLNQLFKIVKEKDRSKVEIRKGITKKDLGEIILKPLEEVDEICDKVINEFPVPTDFRENISFIDFVNESSRIYAEDKKEYMQLGKKCKDCQFYTDYMDAPKMKSGFMECWVHRTKLTKKELEEPLVLEIWNGLAGSVSFPEKLLAMDKYFIREIEEHDLAPKKEAKRTKEGLSNLERRMEQVNRVKTKDTSSYFDKEGIKAEMSKWEQHYPLHMIDFETSMVALPFHKGAKPYEGIAFQFSHHTIDKNWNIKHETQYLSFKQDFFPNFEFVRELKNALSKDKGKIFRYHNHENTYLNMIYFQLMTYPNPPADKDELIAFIKSVTHSGNDSAEKWVGERDMIDLYELVLRYYYSPSAKGDNGLKYILPALINDSEYLKEKYSKPGIYGKNLQVKSLNFDDHTWIRPDVKNNPYKTLPRVFEEYSPETLDSLIKDFENLADGGAALTAYNYLQYSHLPVERREEIKNALLRYCELDTMAMVMILEGWKNLIS